MGRPIKTKNGPFAGERFTGPPILFRVTDSQRKLFRAKAKDYCKKNGGCPSDYYRAALTKVATEGLL